MNQWPNEIAELEPTIVFQSYWKFIAERQKIYLARLNGDPPPWTNDPILSVYKFTNVFRATDRVSQKGIKISYQEKADGDGYDLDDSLFRILLFKFFNKEETWDLLTNALGDEPSLANYQFSRYDKIFTEAKYRNPPVKLYSSAYMMPCPAAYGKPGIVLKHQMHLDIIQTMIGDGLATKMQDAGSLEEAYKLVRSYKMLGDFMAYQFTIDFNYSPHLNYNENDFIVPGPGAKEGIAKCFRNPKKVSNEEIIERVRVNQDFCSLHAIGTVAPTLFERSLHLIDVQNCFCEIAKYARVAHPEFNEGRSRIKNSYSPKTNRAVSKPFFPPKWGLTYPSAV
jgi:hypothetical protein